MDMISEVEIERHDDLPENQSLIIERGYNK